MFHFSWIYCVVLEASVFLVCGCVLYCPTVGSPVGSGDCLHVYYIYCCTLIFLLLFKTYNNETGKSLSIRHKEHETYTRLDYVQSTVTEHEKNGVENVRQKLQSNINRHIHHCQLNIIWDKFPQFFSYLDFSFILPFNWHFWISLEP